MEVRSFLEVGGLGVAGAAILSTTSTAGNKDQNSRNQGQGGGGQNTPDGRTPASNDVVRSPGVDGVLDDLETGEITCHGNDCDDESQGGEKGGDKGADDAGAEAEQKGQEGEAGSDGVQNHYPGKDSGGIAVVLREVELVNLSESGGGIVANVSAGTIIRSV